MHQLDVSFTAPIRRDDKPGAWTIVVMPESAETFGTRRPVKVGGRIDGHPFNATLLPLGDGTHMVPIKAALAASIGKDPGQSVVVELTERRG